MDFIQTLPNSPYFVLALIVVFAYVWMNPPKGVFWKQQIAGNFEDSGHHPACFDCNVSNNKTCYNNLECKALREQMGVDINGNKIR
jgi:hypothetical protein